MELGKICPSEYEEQKALFIWAQYQIHNYPELALMYHIFNEGKRNPSKAKALGIKSGVPDICLPVARGGKHGAYIEMKKLYGGKLTENQEQWINNLIDQGYAVACCKGWQDAAAFIVEYLST